MDREIARLRSRSPGADPEDPYEDIDRDDLPGWWRRAIREFEAHDLRPYRPPRFADGTPTHEVIDGLEAALGVDVSFGSVGEDYRERWSVRVDGEVAAEIGRRRSPDGYTVYEIEPDAFREVVRDAVD